MSKMIQKLLSLLLALVMVLSLAAPVIPAAAEETDAVSETVSESTSDLRMGVLSDIHISYDYVDEVYGNVTGHFNGVQPSRFEKALRFFKAQGVDAVVVAGDLQEASGTDAANLDKQKDWLQTVVDIWFKVFPEKQGEEGYVEPIFIYGNHDSALVSNQYWPEELGSYEDAFIKEVNGYSFVCAHNAKENLATPLLEKVAPQNADKPIFYIQHCPVAYTVPGDYGYGLGYGQVGWNNVAPYHNAVVFNGHTHAPLTDERCIWQGDEGNEGQFTVINTATINYTGLANDDMTVNSYAGNAQQTEHGMLVDVYGSELSIERYSFNDMTIDTASGAVSGEPVKIGETWSFDACDATDRPYAYDSRYANANAPVFPEGAQIAVESVTDTAVTVSLPAASLTAPAGFSDMIEGYVVEACDPTSGKVEAVSRVATSYHVDDKSDVYEATYTVRVSGLKAGTNYILKAYAQEFFDKRSQALELAVTTTGVLASYRVGDVNKDGVIDAQDMADLENILSRDSKVFEAGADIDGNGILEYRDVTELQAILDGSRVAYPESDDLMDLVSAVKLTGVSTSTKYQPVDYGTKIQNSVVRGNSNQAVKTWTTNYAYYPITTMYFSEPVDLSGYTHLSFDTLFENEYNLSDSYRKRWLSLSFISGEQEQVASYGSMNFDSAGDGWTTTTVALVNLKNIDLSAVTGIRFSHNFDYYEGRFDGVTEHAIYWDNFYGSTAEGADTDLLYTATIDGGEAIYGAGYTKNSNHAVLSTGGTVDVTLEKSLVLSDYAGFNVYMRTPVSTTVSVQPYDAEGNLLGTAASIESTYIYQNKTISTANFAVEEGTVAAGLRFTYSCESLLLDTMSVRASKDTDLIGTADGVAAIGEGVSANIVLDGTNGSNNALYVAAENQVSGGVELSFAEALDLSQAPYLRLDLKMENTDTGFAISLYDAQGTAVWTSGDMTAASSAGNYATYELDMSSADLSEVAKIAVSFDLTADGEVWIDNLKACDPMGDFFSASTSLIGPSAVQDGFICEISDFDGHDNVLHWYSDPAANAGTTSAWPGETNVTIQKDVLFANHTGYDASEVDYLEFTIKNTGNYVAFSFSFLDATGATLGSSNGEYRVSLQEDWCTYRIDLASMGLTAEEVSKIDTVSMGWNWQYQNVNGTEQKKVADIYIDNMGFRAYPEESTDALDQVGLIRNSEWWWGGHNTYPGAGWLYQSEHTVDSEQAFMFYRSADTNGMGYSPRILYAYFTENIAVESDWTIKLDVVNENFAKNCRMEIIGSDNKAYTCFAFSGTGSYSLEASVSSLVTSDGVAFDPDTVTVKGLKYYTNYNRDSSVSATAGGYLVLDNLTFTAPVVVPTVSLDGLDLIGNSDSVVLNNTSAFESAFVFEVLDQVDGRDNVVHMYSDPANGGGLTTNSSYYYGPVITLSADSIYTGKGVDYIELNLKNTNIYCDQLYLEVVDASGTKLGSTYKRMATSNDWSYYRFNLALLGLTEEEMESVATVKVFVNWSKQYTGAAAPVVGEVYIDNLSFGSYVDDSTDLFDHAASLQNVEWWWSGNNYYDNAGWLMEEDEAGSSYFKIYRVKDKTSTSTGYNPRRQYLYFDEPIALNENFVVSVTATNDNMGTGSKISLLGDDGNKYGYLLIDKTGTNTYEISVSDIVLLNADTTMTKSETLLDISAVKIKGVILHNDFFHGESTADGSLVMDNLRIYDPTVIEEPTEPETTEPEVTEPEETYPDGGDLLYEASLQYNKDHWLESTGLSYAKDTENTYGENSVQSWRFQADADASNSSAVAQFLLPKAYDFTDCYVAFDAKYVTEGTAAQGVGIRLHNTDWGNHNDVNASVSLTAGDWNTYIVDFADVLLSTADTTDLKLISFYFNFSANTGYERVVYIDNVRLLHKETVEEDWINMSIDGGMSENVSYQVVTDMTRAENSTFSMKVDTGEGYRVTFNTQAAVINGTLSSKVDMTKGGYIGGYFYFGEQTPDVKVRLTDKNWNGGASIPLDVIDCGDGWYYCYKDVSQFYFYDSATNPTKAEIIRVSVVLPTNYSIYIDGFGYPAYVPVELLDYRIVFDADSSRAVANDLLSRIESDLSWKVSIVPDTVEAVDNEIVIGSTARNCSLINDYLAGGSKELTDFDYVVAVEGGKIYLVANTNAGVYQAFDKLVELASAGTIADGIYLKDAHNTEDVADLPEGADTRIMSYNLLYSTEHLVEDRIGNFLNILGYYTPDVVGLQEVSGGSNAGWHEYIYDSLVRDSNYLKACAENASGTSLMTTFLYNPDTVKLISETVYDLYAENSNIRVLAVAVFERLDNGQQFVVTNTHPAPYQSANYSSELSGFLNLAADVLAEYADLPVFMVGDYNTKESVAEYDTILNTLGVYDGKYSAETQVKTADSCPGFGKSQDGTVDFVIDHIFHNDLAQAILYNIVTDHDVEHTSDHIPQYVDFKTGEKAVTPDPTEPEQTEPDTTEPETTEPEKDEDFLFHATCSLGEKQSEVTNDSLISWKISSATGWSYPTFVLDTTYDISKYDLVMDIYPANMTHFRMHLATINGQWLSGAAVYYGVNKWTTVTYNLSANSAGLTEMTNFGLGIEIGAEGSDYALYIDNVRLVERKVNADATEDTEKASDILAIANFEWSGSDWSGNGLLSYTNESDETNGKDSLRSWRFSRKETTGAGYSRAQLKLNQTYDLTDKDLVFDIKFDTGEEIAAHYFGVIPFDSAWQNIFPGDNYMEPTIVAKAGDWYTVRLDNSLLRAYLLEGKDLTSVYLLNFCFQFPKVAMDIYIDNMHLEDHVYGTEESDAASDLLVNATIVENSADDSVYFYEHNNTSVAYGDSSNASHKFYATAAGNAYHSVKYDLGQSYDLTGKNIVMDVLAFRCSTTFLFQLYDSNNNLITSSYRGCASRRWSEVTPAILSNDLDLTDVRYMVIGAYFQPDSNLSDRAFYVDNVRIETIDTYHTALENTNMVFIGDSITASGGYKGWSGELEEHYFINRYNIGAGGTSYANISGRGQIYSQVANIPNVNVDYFVLNGGVNDIWSAWDLGSVSDVSVESATVDSFDTNTTAGGMEKVFCYLRTNYPEAKIAFIITYNCFDGGFDSVRYRDEFVPLAKAVCEKWSIPYLDLVNNDTFNAEFNALPGIHTYDGVHANDVGYDLVMRQVAPWLLSINNATEQTEQNSDMLSYATYEWSASDWTGASTLSYDKACEITTGPDSLRSWKFTASDKETGWPAMQIKLSQLHKTSLTGKALQFDVKFEASNGKPSQKIGLRLYDDSWGSVTGDSVVWKDVTGSDWQTVTMDASEFEAVMAEGKDLDVIFLLQFMFDFATNKGNTQTVYVDNVRVVDAAGVATEETEAASDLLYGAKYVSGNFTNKGFGYDQYNTMFVNGSQSKYSLRMYASDNATAWCNARFELPEVLDLTNKSLKFDVNQYNHVYIGVALYNSDNELITSDGFTLRNEGWQTFEVYLLDGLAEGMTAADLADVKYINFSSSFEYVKTGRVLVVDNVQVYENDQISSVLNGKNALYLGDSISEAISYKGWRGELAEHYGVNDYNVSASGAVLINNQTHNLHQQLAKAPTDVEYDMIILNGGVNDVWRGMTLGEVSPEGTTEFNVDTTIGALEDLFSQMKASYPNAKIFFVLNYTCVQNGYPQDVWINDYAPLARAACEKWDIPYLDLVDHAEFTAEFDATSGVHTYDGVHANTEGYNVITKYLAPWLEAQLSGPTEETEAASDMMFDAYIGAASYTAAKTYLSYDKACTEQVHGDQSLYALKLAYDGTDVDGSIDAWPYIWINFGKDVDFTGKKLVFDVLYLSDTAEQSLSVRQLLDSGWSAISSTTKGVNVTAGQWTTVEFDMADFVINDGKSLENVNLFGIQIGLTKGVSETLYIDNIRLVDAA